MSLPHSASNAASCTQSQDGDGIIGVLGGLLDKPIALAGAARSAEGCPQFQAISLVVLMRASVCVELRARSLVCV